MLYKSTIDIDIDIDSWAENVGVRCGSQRGCMYTVNVADDGRLA